MSQTRTPDCPRPVRDFHSEKLQTSLFVRAPEPYTLAILVIFYSFSDSSPCIRTRQGIALCILLPDQKRDLFSHEESRVYLAHFFLKAREGFL
jgi:hypothetical protein